MKPSLKTSEALFEKARGRMPGGVSSPVRAFGKVGGVPRYIAKAAGPFLWDEDGNQLLDFCLAWGPNILGHAHPAVVEAVVEAARNGLAFGTTHRNEVALADLVLEAFPEHQLVRFVVSGTEAVATAIRLARGVTGRPLTLKFTGCYHGHVDSLLVKAGSGVVTQGLSDSKGVPEGLAATTVVVPLDDEAAMISAFEQYGSKLAAAIVEPLPANNGLLLQRKVWLETLRAQCTKHGTVLIFDEVINGFRFHFGGYGRLMGVTPDLTTLGKIVGGGLPVAAVAGRRELLSQLAPSAACTRRGRWRETRSRWRPVSRRSRSFESRARTRRSKPSARASRQGGSDGARASGCGESARSSGRGSTRALRRRLPRRSLQRWSRGFTSRTRWLDAGIYLPPSGYEVGFLSTAHTPAHVDRLLEVMFPEAG